MQGEKSSDNLVKAVELGGPPSYNSQGHRVDNDNWEPESPVDLSLSPEDEQLPNAWRPLAQPRSWVMKTQGGYTILDFNPTVFVGSIAIIWGFVIWAATGDEAEISEDLGDVKGDIVRNFSWFYCFAVNVFMIFCAYMAFSSYGDIRLGQKPDFNFATWITMLFSAGIGIGLYYWGVQEPIYHYATLNRHNYMYLRPEAVADYNAAKNLWATRVSAKAMESFPSSPYAFNPALAFTYESRFLRALDGMNISIFNWGYSASSTYVVIGLPLAYYHYNHNLPLSMRTAFYPILGNRINGWVGDIIDIAAICGTVFGVCTSLGLGIMQLTDGLAHQDDWFPNKCVKDDCDAKETYTWLIIIITCIATISVVTGLEVGIRRMSELNFLISSVLFIMIFFMSNPSFFMDFLLTTFMYHFQYLPYLMGYADGLEKAVAQHPNDPSVDIGTGSLAGWTSWWTVFYWAWWISWSPFVGQFLARISKGRTIREFVLVNVGVTTLLVMIWFVVFGGQAYLMNMDAENRGLNCLDVDIFCKDANGDYLYTDCGPFDPVTGDFLMHTCYLGGSNPGGGGGMMLWYLIDYFPFKGFLGPLAIVGLAIFFVTSSDSASQVVDNIASNGSHEPPVWQRIFWAVTEGATALTLLHAGETASGALGNLQSVSIIFALPLTVIMLGMCFSLWVGLRTEDGSIKPKNFWKTMGVDSLAHMVGTTLGIGAMYNASAAPTGAAYWIPCMWDGGLSLPMDWLWAVITILFPCVTQVRNFLEFSAAEGRNDSSPLGMFKKFMWIFWLVAPWCTVMTFSFFCEDPALGTWGPYSRGCKWLDGVEGLLGLFYALMVMIGVMQRMWVRELRGIEKPSNAMMDVAWMCFCPHVAIYQVLKEPRQVVKMDEEEAPTKLSDGTNQVDTMGPTTENL